MTFAEEAPCTLKYNSKGEQPQCNGPEHKTKLQNLKTFSFQSSFFIAYCTVILLRGLGLIESYIATCLIFGEIQMLLKCVERIKRKMILMQRCSLKDNVRKIFLRKEIGSFDLEVCWQKSVSEKFSFSFEKRIDHFTLTLVRILGFHFRNCPTLKSWPIITKVLLGIHILNKK